MGDVQSGVVGDDVVVDGQDGFGVRLDPGNLSKWVTSVICSFDTITTMTVCIKKLCYEYGRASDVVRAPDKGNK